jgi:hypothetical protein
MQYLQSDPNGALNAIKLKMISMKSNKSLLEFWHFNTNTIQNKTCTSHCTESLNDTLKKTITVPSSISHSLHLRLIHTYHAVPLPCHAAKGLDCVFPIWFTQCGRVWFIHAMPRLCHVMTMPFWKRILKATAQHSMCELASAVQRRLPWGVPRKLLSEAYQSVKL